MNLRVIYCNHESADVAARERLAFANAESLAHAYHLWSARYADSEIVILSTCNRVELYCAHPETEGVPSDEAIVAFLAETHCLDPTEVTPLLRVKSGAAAVSHLFEVVSSLDSMVLGEPQIVAQVKEAYERAYVAQVCGPLTNGLFQMAFRVSSRVRTETSLAEGRVSIASVAVGDFGRSIFNSFDDKRVLVVGAGAMAEETLRYLTDAGAKRFIVTNRSPDRARLLAATCGAAVAEFEELDRLIAETDVIVSATGATEPIMTAERYRRIRRDAHRPIFILDLATPRDFDPAISKVDEYTFLYDVDDLKATCDANRAARHREVEKARRIIAEETERFASTLFHRATGSVIRRLRDEWHDIRQQELDLLFAKLPNLTERDRAAIDKTVERIVNKLLHPPLEVLKSESREGTPHGLLDALRRLFRLAE